MDSTTDAHNFSDGPNQSFDFWQRHLLLDELLLWAVQKSDNILIPALLRGAFFLAVFSAIVYWNAPVSWNVSEYCVGKKYNNCEIVYYISWPIVLFSVIFGLTCLGKALRITLNPNRIYYAISSMRGLRIASNGSMPISVPLKGQKIGTTFFGSLRFGIAKIPTLIFSGLSDDELKDAIRAAKCAGALE